MGRPRKGSGVAITRRKDGRLVAAVNYRDDDDRARRIYVYGHTVDEVTDKVDEVRSRIANGLPAKDAKVRLDAFAATWIDGTLAISDRKPATKELYERLTRRHIIGSDLGGMALDRIRPRHVETWIARLRVEGKSASTIRSDYTVLRAIFDTAVRDELLIRNPVAVVPRPKVTPTEAEYLSPEQVRSLLAAAKDSGRGRPGRDGRYAPLFALLVNTGMRRGEALALQWSDVDLEERAARVRGTLSRVGGELTVTETKTDKSRRTVPLSDEAVAVLKTVRKRQLEERLRAGTQWHDTRFVFTTELGEPCDPRNALRALKVAAMKSGLPPIGLHTLRHSAASVMISNGVPLKVVSDLLGHASISVTADVYGHVSPDISRSAIDQLAAALDS